MFIQLKMRGSLYCQAERKELPLTLIPDMDNAIVGSQHIIDFWGYPYRVSPFLLQFIRKEVLAEKNIQAEGERPVLFVKRWEPVFQGERVLLSTDRTKLMALFSYKYEKRKKQ